MDEKHIDLRAALRELADEESGNIGPHCGLKRLIAYRQGTLPAAERETVQEHLSLCPRCTQVLLELRDFEAATAGAGTGPESQRREAWDALVRRLPAATPEVRPSARPSAPPSASTARPEAPPRRRSPRLAAGLAAALLIALAGLTLWAATTVVRERQRLTRLEQRLEERDAALTAAQAALAQAESQLAAARGQIQSLQLERSEGQTGQQAARREAELTARVAKLSSELEALRRRVREPETREPIAATSRKIEVSVTPRFALRGREATGSLRGGGVVNPVRTTGQEGRFTVALSLADQPVFPAYRLELADRDGKVLWAARRPAGSLLGDAGTSVSASGLDSGLYRLRIEGLRPDGGQLLADYLLEVEPDAGRQDRR